LLSSKLIGAAAGDRSRYDRLTDVRISFAAAAAARDRLHSYHLQLVVVLQQDRDITVTPCDVNDNCSDVTALYGGMAWYDIATTSWSGNETLTTTSADEGLPPLGRYSVWYAAYHGYISLVVCAVGIIGNVFNIVVLTRPNMVSSSTNCILTALAVSDLITMIVYVPFAIQFYCQRHIDPAADTLSFTPDQANTFGWTAFLLFYVHTSVTAHTVSIWLAVLLSVVRYIYVRPGATATLVGGSDGGLGRVRCAIVGVYAFAVVILIPTYLSLVVRPSATADRNGNILPVTCVCFHAPCINYLAYLLTNMFLAKLTVGSAQ